MEEFHHLPSDQMTPLECESKVASAAVARAGGVVEGASSAVDVRAMVHASTSRRRMNMRSYSFDNFLITREHDSTAARLCLAMDAPGSVKLAPPLEMDVPSRACVVDA